MLTLMIAGYLVGMLIIKSTETGESEGLVNYWNED
jgi:hypothetical protein